MDPIRTDREPASCVSADVGSAPLPRGGRPVRHAMFLTSDAAWLLGQLLGGAWCRQRPGVLA